MITLDQFKSLRAGDIVVWHQNPNKPSFRTVVAGPSDHPNGHLSCSFPIKNRSWTKRSHTTYDWNTLKHIISYTGKRSTTIFSPQELERILSKGLKPLWDLKWMMDWHKRTGWRCSRRAFGMALKAQRSLEFAEIQ